MPFKPTRYQEAKALALKDPRHRLLADIDLNGNKHHLFDVGDYLKEEMLRQPPNGTAASNWTRTGIPHPTKKGRVIGIRRAMKLLKRYQKHGGEIDTETMKRIQKRYQQPYETAQLYGTNPGKYESRGGRSPGSSIISGVGKVGRKAGRGAVSAGKTSFRAVSDAGRRAGESMSEEQFATAAGSIAATSVSLAAVWAIMRWTNAFT